MDTLLNRPVLVLNRLWQPLHTCSARRALKLLCLGHAEVVETEGEAKFQTHDIASWIDRSAGNLAEDLIHSVKVALRVPKIIVLAIYDRLPRKEVKFTRHNVFLRDKFTCQYCVTPFPEHQLNLDHVLPRDKGGRTNWENIVTSCIQCNTRKSNKLLPHTGMKLLKKPAVPRWRPHFGMRTEVTEESWADFLFPDCRQVRMAGG